VLERVTMPPLAYTRRSSDTFANVCSRVRLANRSGGCAYSSILRQRNQRSLEFNSSVDAKTQSITACARAPERTAA
jgi:hypothetical protein